MTDLEAATILLIEDDPSLLEGIPDLLELADIGYDVRMLTAQNGLEGLKVLEAETPDLIISDIMMPKMGGFEFLGHLRQKPDWVNIPVIFLSARGTRQDILQGRLSGAELYITKPFDNDELLELVRSQLDRAFALQHDRERRMDGLRRNIIQVLNHEFRTPLTYVTAYYEMLADSLAVEEISNLHEYLRGIQIGAIRLSRLVEDFIKVIEIRTGEAATALQANSRPIDDISQLLRTTCQAYQVQVEEKQGQFHYEIPEQLPVVYGDRDSLGDILSRLLDNAVKFSLHKRHNVPEISVSAGTRDGNLYFSVKDNGVGFPEKVTDQLFELFFQYNREEYEQQGSGAGLTIVKGMVSMHDGRIEVESEEGQGSTFTVLLPLYGAQAEGVVTGDGSAEKELKSANVLIVEDEWYLLDGLRDLLELFETGYDIKVYTASNGRQGLEVLAKNQPDLIISDIMMPYMDGYEFLDEVRRNAAWLHIPFIFLTAKGERKDIIRGWRSGVEEYITKPYDSTELLDLVATQLNRHFQRQAVMYQNFDSLKRGILELLRPDFRMPLTFVSNYSEQLAQNLDLAQTDEDLKASLEGIQSGSSHITRLVEDFIFLAELRTGEVDQAFQWRARSMNVGALLLEIGFNRLEREGKIIEVERRLAKGLLPTLADYEQLKKAFERLLAVLVRLCAEEEDAIGLVMEASPEDEQVCLRFSIQPAELGEPTVTRINELLAREEMPVVQLSEYDPGLAVVRGIIGLHSGQVWFEDKAGICSAVIVLPHEKPAVDGKNTI